MRRCKSEKQAGGQILVKLWFWSAVLLTVSAQKSISEAHHFRLYTIIVFVHCVEGITVSLNH